MKNLLKQKQIFALIDGRIEGKKKEKLLQHIAECDRCRRLYTRALNTKKQISTIGEKAQPPIDWKQLDAKVMRIIKNEEITSRPEPSFAEFFWRLAFVASLLLFFFSAYLVMEKYKTKYRITKKTSTQMVTVSPLPPEKMAEGFVTFTSKKVIWSTESISPKPLELETPLIEGMKIMTPTSGAAGLQIGKLTGIRVEGGSQMKIALLTENKAKIHLTMGKVEVKVEKGRKWKQLAVETQEAIVLCRSTLFSVEKRQSWTKVIVSRGKVDVIAGDSSSRTKHYSLSSKRGIRVDSRWEITELSSGETEKESELISTLFFNIFSQQIMDSAVVLQRTNFTEVKSIEIEGKLLGIMEGAFRRPEKVEKGNLKINLEDGSTRSISFASRDVKKVKIDLGKFAPAKISSVEKQTRRNRQPKEQIPERLISQLKHTEQQQEQQEGYLDPVIIKMKMGKARGIMRACYEKFLSTRAVKVVVKAKIEFTIGESGRVVQPQVLLHIKSGDGSGKKELASCLKGVIKTVVFPQPEGGKVRVEYPVTFTPH